MRARPRGSGSVRGGRETVADAVARRQAGAPEGPAARRRPRREPADPAGTDRAGPRPAAPRPASPAPRYRRRRRVAALLAGVLLLAGIAVVVRVLLYDLGLADVENVRVTGTVAVPVEAVLAAAAVVPGGPLVAVDTAAIAARVGALPGVASVDVGLGWPHTVAVGVTERAAAAVTDTPQGPRPVDAGGVVYPGTAPPDVPRLAFGGVGPDDPATRAALAVLAELPEQLAVQVRTVDAATGGGTAQVSLGLTEGRLVRWGTADRAVEKSSVLVALLTQPGRVYDVTSPELPTVRS